MKIYGVIPARFGSSRFPGKPLIDIRGTSMIMRVFQQASKASSLDKVIVATDDQRIFDHVTEMGGEVMMTSSDHLSGTDRIAEVALAFPDVDIFINIQGDEPFISPDQINLVAGCLSSNKDNFVATLVQRTTDESLIEDSNTAKVVIDQKGKALYFSRAAIPFPKKNASTYFLHIGIYAYPANVLKQISNLSPSELEKIESLEQLRWLENGIEIHTKESTEKPISIDTPDDLAKAIEWINEQ